LNTLIFCRSLNCIAVAVVSVVNTVIYGIIGLPQELLQSRTVEILRIKLDFVVEKKKMSSYPLPPYLVQL